MIHWWKIGTSVPSAACAGGCGFDPATAVDVRAPLRGERTLRRRWLRHAPSVRFLASSSISTRNRWAAREDPERPKTERAQAEVDARRTLGVFADAFDREQFDEAAAREAAELRVGSAERLRDAAVKALGRLHAILDPEQRERLAYLIRTGTLVL
jgi:hypothetical protein